MTTLRLIGRYAIFGILLVLAPPVLADDLQDASKLFKQGQNAQALEKVNAFLAIKPKDAQGRFLKGLIYAEQGNTSDAIALFSGLTEDYPELPEPYNNLAVLYAGQGQYEKAKNELEMAIRTHPSYATAHENLGDIYAKMASQAYDRALQLDKDNTNTQTKLALIRELFSKNNRGITKSSTAVATDAAVPVTISSVVAVTPVSMTPIPPKPVVAVTASSDARADVLKATQGWAAAWSAKDSRKYLSYYAREFKVPGGMSFDAWQAQRKARIAAPKSIRIEIHDATIDVQDSQHASVHFRQAYRASHLSANSSKTLVWVKTDGQWLIAEERAGG